MSTDPARGAMGWLPACRVDVEITGSPNPVSTLPLWVYPQDRYIDRIAISKDSTLPLWGVSLNIIGRPMRGLDAHFEPHVIIKSRTTLDLCAIAYV